MARKRYTSERIFRKLREAEFNLPLFRVAWAATGNPSPTRRQSQCHFVFPDE